MCRAEGVDLSDFAALFPADDLCAGRATVIRDNRPDQPMATLAVFGHMLTRVQQQALYAGINPATPDFHADYFRKAVAAGLGPQAGTATCKVV